jgi:hypothetical protein
MSKSIKPGKTKARRYTGNLAEPIYEGAAGSLDDSVQTSYRKVDKLLELFDLYNIDSLGKHSWLRLALALAEQHVPGFRVVHELPRKRGRSRTWKAGRADALLRDVDEVRSADKKLTIKSAIDSLRDDPSKEWGKIPEQTLMVRHREARRQQKERDRLASELRKSGPIAGLGGLRWLSPSTDGK